MVCTHARCRRRRSIFDGVVLFLAWLLSATSPAALQAQTPVADALSSSETADGAVDAKLRALLDVLEDEQARAELIDQLQALTGVEAAPAESAPAAVSLARQVADLTGDAAEEASALAGRVWRDIRVLGAAIADGRLSFSGLIGRHAGLIGTIAATFAVLAILRLLRRPLLERMAVWTVDGGVGAAFRLLGMVLIDTLAVLLAFACGNALALGVFGETGRISVDESLFLNGFLVVELLKAVLRGLISPRAAGLRFLPIGDRTAGFAYRRASAIGTLIGYGVLVIAPLVHAGVSPASARAIAVLAMIAALVLVLLGIRRLKALLADEALVSAAKSDLTGRALAGLGQIWPYLASIYAIGIFLIGISRPTEALPFVLGATLRSVLAVAIGVALVIMIGKVVKNGVPLPSSLRANLPQLGRRLDRLVPNLLWALRILVLISVVLTVIDAFDLFDIGGWLRSEDGEAIAGAAVSVALIAALAYLIWLAAVSWIEYRLSTRGGHIAGPRERTLLSLFGNAITIALATIATMLVLSELGLNIGPLLAGAGVVGLAVGFGAQKLVQDIITGVFIQFENAINTGDVVTVAGTTGEVEHLSVRSIGLRDLAGTYHLIPFSTVDRVSNFNRGFAYHVADIGIAYKESVAEAKEAMQVAFDRLKESEHGEHLLGDLEMFGVNALGDSAVVLRARLCTAPGEQWAVGRAYNERVKEVFDERGIDIPFPHMTVYMGTDKSGKSQLDGFLPASS